MDIGSAAGRAHGIAAEQIANLNNYRSDFNFSDLERLVLEYADGMTRTPLMFQMPGSPACGKNSLQPELVELSSAIAGESYRARFDHAFGIEAENFSALPSLQPAGRRCYHGV
jgi:hypothetical protein